jgi:hypothetical protein
MAINAHCSPLGEAPALVRDSRTAAILYARYKGPNMRGSVIPPRLAILSSPLPSLLRAVKRLTEDLHRSKSWVAQRKMKIGKSLLITSNFESLMYIRSELHC